MKLNIPSLKETVFWDKAGIAVPQYDVSAMAEATKEEPIWIHFGAGNIFRCYIAGIQNKLLNAGLADRGIIAVDSSDGDQIVKVYKPYDNLTLSVELHADGKADKAVIASIADAIHADWSKVEELSKLKEIFRCPALQLCSFTITEKGYGITKGDGSFLPAVAADIENGPEKLVNVMSKVTALLYERFLAGGAPLAVVSMDNCSHNGEKLRSSIVAIAREWLKRGFVPAEFLTYLENESKVSFPWSMIDKITPRPNADIAKMLADDGVEAMDIIPRAKGAPCAPFVNAESSEYLVIEDRFPNGRPAFEKVGVYMADRETVNKTERMKVTTCLNPLHTAMAVLGCLLGYDRIYKEMQNPDIKALVERIGKVEGMPVVTDPKIIDPNAFLLDVLENRLPNSYIPDMPQRIACDTSQKVPVRFGETIKSYLASDTLELSSLRAIPFAIAAWMRYLLAVDDEMQPMQLSEDPRIGELQEKLCGIEAGKPESYAGQLKNILCDASIFGADLTATPLFEQIEKRFVSMLEGSGAVKKALHELNKQ